MGSRLIDLADLLVTHINGGSYSDSFTAERAIVPEYSLKDIADLTVCVLPVGMSIETIRRGNDANVLNIDVLVLKKLDCSTTATRDSEIDDMMVIMEELADRIRVYTPAASGSLMSSEFMPIYDPEYLETYNGFFGVIRTQFLVSLA